MTLAKLRAVAAVLKVLKPTWKVKVYSVKECDTDGWFDPPCAFLRKTNGNAVFFQFCADGEFYLYKGDSYDDAPVMLDPNRKPADLAMSIATSFDEFA